MADIYSQRLEVRVPVGDSVDLEALEAQVEAAVARLKRRAEFDGVGHGADAFDMFIYAKDIEELLDAVLAVEYPPGTVGHVAVHDAKGSSFTQYRVTMASPGKGQRTEPEVETFKLKAGDWFLFPMKDGPFLVGRVTRLTSLQVIAYFFGAPRGDRPSEAELSAYTLDDSIAHARLERSEIDDGTWPLLGPAGSFKQKDWPLPELEFYWRDQHFKSTLTRSLFMKERIPIPESEWWQRSPEELNYGHGIEEVLEQAVDDPDNKYVMPPKPEYDY